MVARTRACTTKMGCGTAGQSTQRSVQEDDVSAYNFRERYTARGVGRDPERKYTGNTAPEQRGTGQKSSIPNIRRIV